MGQFTGLKDNGGKGKDVYEGDILAWEDAPPNGEDWPDSTIDTVVYEQASFYLATFCGVLDHSTSDVGDVLDDSTAKDSRIIGNIHQNPELLKVKEKTNGTK